MTKKKLIKTYGEYRIFEPTRAVPSTLQQPPTDTTAQGSTNGGHMTAEGGKGNVET